MASKVWSRCSNAHSGHMVQAMSARHRATPGGEGPDRAADRAAAVARALWLRLEPIHALTYFAPEIIQARRDVGLRGFWMGYFGGRLAPCGPIGAEVGTALAFGFSPDMVARALPDAWSFASPDEVLDAQFRAISTTLAGLLSGTSRDTIEEALDLLDSASGLVSDDLAGRPLAAAHLSLEPPAGWAARLWHAATTLREHRGDGHVLALRAHGIGGLEAHVLAVAIGPGHRDVIEPNRGWSASEWDRARAGLNALGLIDAGEMATAAGRALHHSVEETTDALASSPWRRLGDARTTRLIDLLEVLVEPVVASGVVPFPNPMGLPRRVPN